MPSCELVDAQNSLLAQSIRDERGESNPHGWGIVERLADGSLDWEREAEPANEDDDFRREVIETPALATIAHIRRATVGEPKRQNTHPFVADDAALAHNGHIGAFDRVRPRLLEAMTPEWRARIDGTTDSEHVFALLMSRLPERSRTAMLETLAGVIADLDTWTADEDESFALNVLWLVDDILVGSRLRRSLHFMERDHAYECPVCGKKHAADASDYSAVVVASEPITGEEWTAVPEGVLWSVEDWRFVTRPI